MAKIPFDIKYRPQIESGKYMVVDNYDNPVRIICWDASNSFPIIYLDGQGNPFARHIDGTTDYRNGPMLDYKQDLFVITVPELITDFEKELGGIAQAWVDKRAELTIECIKVHAERLLKVARKELQLEINAEIDKAYKNSDKEQYRRGKEDALKELYCGREDYKEAISEKIRNMVSKLFNGKDDITSKRFADDFAWELLTLAKAEALKDVPKWKATKEGEEYNLCITRELDVNADYHYCLSRGSLALGQEYITIADLEKLERDK